MLHNFPVTLVSKKEIAENTVEMTFDVTAPGFTFIPGQYVSVEIASLSELAVPLRCHDFSIASSPASPSQISFAFRVSKSAFKTALLGLPIGGEVTVSGPKGVFTLPVDTDTPLVFVAGGIGITPFLSMIRFATESASPQVIKLLYLNTKESTTAYRDDLRALAKQNPNFTFEEFLGVPTPETFAPSVSVYGSSPWYLVGAPAMVEHVQDILRGFGILDEQVRTEEFSGYDAQ